MRYSELRLKLWTHARLNVQAKTASGFSQEDHNTSGSEEIPRNGRAPEGDQKASTSGRSGGKAREGPGSKTPGRGLGHRLWNAYSVVKQEVTEYHQQQSILRPYCIY